MYQNKPMTRDEAIDLAADIGHALSAKTTDGLAIQGTAKVGLKANGEGFDVCVPVELLHRLISPAPETERAKRISAWERLFGRKENS